MGKVAEKATSSNWGGRRPNQTGRPPTKISDELKTQVARALKKKAKETGLSFGDFLVSAAYGEQGTGNIQTAAMKLIADILVVRESKSTVEKIETPKIYLPEIAPRPKEIEEQLQQAVH